MSEFVITKEWFAGETEFGSSGCTYLQPKETGHMVCDMVRGYIFLFDVARTYKIPFFYVSRNVGKKGSRIVMPKMLPTGKDLVLEFVEDYDVEASRTNMDVMDLYKRFVKLVPT